MKDKLNKINTGNQQKEEYEISCGNCWGHQEYTDGYLEKTIDIARDKKDNFISRFVKKYIQTT